MGFERPKGLACPGAVAPTAAHLSEGERVSKLKQEGVQLCLVNKVSGPAGILLLSARCAPHTQRPIFLGDTPAYCGLIEVGH